MDTSIHKFLLYLLKVINHYQSENQNISTILVCVHAVNGNTSKKKT